MRWPCGSGRPSTVISSSRQGWMFRRRCPGQRAVGFEERHEQRVQRQALPGRERRRRGALRKGRTRSEGVARSSAATIRRRHDQCGEPNEPRRPWRAKLPRSPVESLSPAPASTYPAAVVMAASVRVAPMPALPGAAPSPVRRLQPRSGAFRRRFAVGLELAGTRTAGTSHGSDAAYRNAGARTRSSLDRA